MSSVLKVSSNFILLSLFLLFINFTQATQTKANCEKEVISNYPMIALRMMLLPVTEDAYRLDDWLKQFPPHQRSAALDIVMKFDVYNLQRTMKSLRSLHSTLLDSLLENGFISSRDTKEFTQVDFMGPYTAKSGDIVTGFYRKANGIRSVEFIHENEMKASPENKDRALVVIDDYAGTGVQFLLEYYAKRFSDQMNSYKKIYFLTMVSNTSATVRFSNLSMGRVQYFSEEIFKLFPMMSRKAKDELKGYIARIDTNKLIHFHSATENPLVLDPDGQTNFAEHLAARRFLLNNGKFDSNLYPFAPFGVAKLTGSTVFLWGPPNTVPEIFWAKHASLNGRPLLPLFERHEDISHYDFAQKLPPEQHVW